MQKYTFTNEEIREINNGLSRLTGKEIPLILSVRVGQALRRLKPHVKHFQEDQEDIVIKYGVRQDDGGYKILTPKEGGDQAKLDEANDLLDDVAKEEHTVHLREIPLSLFKKENGKYMDVDPAVFLFADPILVNDIDGDDEKDTQKSNRAKKQTEEKQQLIPTDG